ncbi:MAG: cobalamin biosynthesis protein [Arachnia propionica]|uniref:cobalamin biosynthesis protein n=1 Tax=Arachnia propionica TaxID=1750 RepID=UPI002710D564|nr:cobalamin biosynthesis protein [Arachnia propionica]
MSPIHRALGLVLGTAADHAFGDPERHHPVAWFGFWATHVEQYTWRDDHRAGGWFTLAAVIPVVGTALLVERVAARRGWAEVATTALATWTALGTRRLAVEGQVMAQRLRSRDLEAAREQLPNLCGRDPSRLDADGLGRATVESMAENTNDAGVSTLFWGAVAGVPGIIGHRCLNTLDAMVGHRNERYERFGAVAARLDDAAAWLPARITGVLACGLAPLVGGDTGRAWRMMRRDHARHPSPNGGWCESAWAGALGVQLGGENRYGERVETRPTLGEGPRPRAREVHRAARLVTVVTWAAAGIAATVLGGLALWGRRRR